MTKVAGRSVASVGRRSPWAVPAALVVAALWSWPVSGSGHVASPAPTFRPVTTQDERYAVENPVPHQHSTFVVPRRLDPSDVAPRDPVPRPSPGFVVVGGSIAGTASYYDYHGGQAAAGPGLRRFLGANWRGTSVFVRAGSVTLPVVLTDWCQCSTDPAHPKLIDLDAHDFGLLAPLSRGTVEVILTTGPQSEGAPSD